VQELSPLKDGPGIRDQLASLYKDAVAIFVARRQLDAARRWLGELKELGPEYGKLVAISEDAIEHIGKPEDDHGGEHKH
jgi:hypothetical protein